jgi:putative glutamine amidotransferase
MPASPRRRPVVGVSCCVKPFGDHLFHAAGAKYIEALAEGAGALPVLLPSLGDLVRPEDAVAGLDGLLLTGSPSNVGPHHYGQDLATPELPADAARDSTTLPLIRTALDRGLPVFAICRGIQELNVALGGTLFQRVHRTPDRSDHRSDEDRPVEEQYGPAHPVRLTPGGYLAGLFGAEEIVVNSLHGQGIDRPAERLVVEATAPDGQIEAVRVDGARSFALGVQWHPEWRYRENPHGRALFAAFGEALRG